MAPMKWATRVIQWIVQDKTIPVQIDISATEFLKAESRVIVDQTCYGEVLEYRIILCRPQLGA